MSKITVLSPRIRARAPTVKDPWAAEQQVLDFEREGEVQKRILREKARREAASIAAALVQRAIREMAEK